MSDDDIIVNVVGELPEFEGLRPIGVLTKLKGAAQRINRPMHHGEKVILVVEAEVSGVNHPMTKEGLKREHVLQVGDLYELAGRPGNRLMSRLKNAWRLADDDRHGRTALEGIAEGADGVELATDGSGVVLTDGDLDALGLSDSGSDPVLAVFLGGARCAWPDDFAAGDPRPNPGDVLAVPGGDGGEDLVVELLDMFSGETLGTWSEDDQARREAAQDREVVEELEARRDRLMGLEDTPPWPSYDGMTVPDVVKLIAVSDLDLLDHVRRYEGAHKDRATIHRRVSERAEALRTEQAEAERDAVDEAMAETFEDLPELPEDGES